MQVFKHVDKRMCLYITKQTIKLVGHEDLKKRVATWKEMKVEYIHLYHELIC